MSAKSIKRKVIILFLSLFFHFLSLIVFSLIHYWIIEDNDFKSNYLSLNFKDYHQPEIKGEKFIHQENKIEESFLRDNQNANEKTINSVIIYDSLIHIADTTDLDSIYIDDSRGFVIKFPLGWSFLDQRINSKFDGVTFWPEKNGSEYIPYVHLEVAEKELFLESRYEFNIQHSDIIWYFNSPEILGDFVNLEIYIKTKKDVDYRIKLIVKGLTNFNSFHPKFLAMLRSLRFKNEYFDIF